ncbi:probable Clustered mitochondria protein homolog [Melanopsichium pennsylvanicum]|uniref:Clustered mitochondria protein homolog n=2 Tax=Melanopsichium pennsylvanicum TaxID=63383 RepID=A0AAJ5C895_9BASI|nr:related to CLU1-translation initiation factor eIF3 [Melanopsichium pennsylvanicum 4]SNX87269.1 probable Clustered mitochondria protein homolog [Melanopsichium pennsylvanicum]
MAHEQSEAATQPPSAPEDVQASELDESLQPFEISLYLPRRPLVPSATATAHGLPETPWPLKVAVTPQETLNDLRVTITDSPEGYWLGAFCFRKPIAGSASTAKAGTKIQLGDLVPEWIELGEIFNNVPKDKRQLHVTHVPFNEADARAHIQRLRDLLSGGAADPSAIGVDAALSVQDAVRNPHEWQQHSAQQNGVDRAPTKKGTIDAAQKETQLPLADWQGWPAVTPIDLIPQVARRPRALPICLRQLSLATWNPPPQHWSLNGHLLYLQVGTLEGEVIFITASTHGFYVNKSSGARFDPTPRAYGHDFASCSLFDLLCGFSPLFLSTFSKLFNDPLSSRDYFSAVPVTNSLPAFPWLARNHPHNADPLRSQAAFLLTGATSADTLEGTRDWNDELQSARELPRTTLPERLVRDRVLNRIYSEFTQAAARAIPKVAAGEVQAMNPMDTRDAQMFIVNNLFISKGADGVDLYPHMGGDEAAHVAVGKDIQGVKTLNSLDVAGLCMLGTIVVDWKGERWVAQSVVPGLFRRRDDTDDELENGETKAAEESEEAEVKKAAEAKNGNKADLNDDTQVVYGGVEGPEVIRDNTAFHKLFNQVAQTLHLDEHDVEDANGKKHPLWLSVDSKGLRGADGRRYVLDLARLNPVDINWLENDVSGPVHGGAQSSTRYPHRMTLLRPELLEIYWDSEFRKWARAKLAARQEVKAAKEAEGKAQEENKQDGENADKVEVAEEEPERLDSSEFKLTFNPDAFVEFKVADASVEDGSKVITPITDESDASVAAVRQASDFLRKVAIPRFVTDVAAGLFTAADGGALSRQMHARGINIRYLGYVARLCSAEAKEELDQDLIKKAGPGHEGFLNAFRLTVLQEMVLRASKRILRHLIRNVEQVNIAACISHFLNCLVGDKFNANPEARPISSPLLDNTEAEWTKLTPESLKAKLTAEIRQRFRFELPASFFDQELRRAQLLREVALRTGIQLKLQDYVFEAKIVDVDVAVSEKSEAQANGHVKENGTAGKKSKNKKNKGSNEQNGGKKANGAGVADKNTVKVVGSTSFEPEDVLNLVPIVKDSTPKSTLAEEAFEAGRISISRGDRDLGLELLLEGVSFHEQVYGLVHPEVARCYALFATIVHHLAGVVAMERAELINQAKQENKELTEADLPSVNDHISMANAVRYQRQAVTVSERTLGLDHPETLNQYMNLAVLERSAGNTRESLLCQRRVLELWSLLHGEQHPDCINALSNVALTLQNARLFESSLRVYKSAHELAISLFGVESIHTANLAHELSQAYTLAGDLKTALTVEKEAWRVFEARLGKDDSQTKESEAFCSSLAASAVRVARLEQEAKARQAQQGAFVLPTSANGNRTNVTVSSAIGGREQTNSNTSGKSLDEIVKFIQGASSTPTKSKSGKTRRK